jgi:dihydropteroate synthase
MGIVNATPDSFQAEGRCPDARAAIDHGLRLIDEGADLLDIGGESTRPGADTVSVEEEIRRVTPVVEALAGSGAPISIDTRKAAVAQAAIEVGAVIVNDVSGGVFDPGILAAAASANAFLCLMHSPLDVGAMGWSTARNPTYANVVSEVRAFLLDRAKAAEAAGVARDRIWIDPGFGFGKSVDENLDLLRRLHAFVDTGYPVLVGTSRKSTLGKVLDDAAPEDRVIATLATVALAVAQGAAVVRVHDVAAAVEVARVSDAILTERLPNKEQ